MVPPDIRAMLLWSCVFWWTAPAATAEEPEERLHPLAQVKFEGATAFDSDAIRNALLPQPDVQWALRHEAPQGELASVLQEKVTAGYRHAGFGDVCVKVRSEWGADGLSQELVVDIQEGTRFRVGEIRFENAGEIPIAKVIERLSLPLPPKNARAYPFDGDQGPRIVWLDFDGKEAECDPPLWDAENGAAFDESFPAFLQQHLAAILSDVGFPQTRFDSEVERVEAESRADLVISVEEVGRPAKVARIDVVGNQRNSREAILEYLQVEPSVVFTREERLRIEKRLWDSGRFSDFYVRLIEPPSDDEPFVLQIDVEECPRVTPLGQPITCGIAPPTSC